VAGLPVPNGSSQYSAVQGRAKRFIIQGLPSEARIRNSSPFVRFAWFCLRGNFPGRSSVSEDVRPVRSSVPGGGVLWMSGLPGSLLVGCRFEFWRGRMKTWKKVLLGAGGTLVLLILVAVGIQQSHKGVVTVQTGKTQNRTCHRS